MNLDNLTDLELLILIVKCERKLKNKKIVDVHNRRAFENISVTYTTQHYLTDEDRELWKSMKVKKESKVKLFKLL